MPRLPGLPEAMRPVSVAQIQWLLEEAGPQLHPLCRFQLLPSPAQVDAALGFAFLNIKVAFEIMVFCLFRKFSKSAKA
jgi:hypothetical protein